jgi:hypothetical protein
MSILKGIRHFILLLGLLLLAGQALAQPEPGNPLPQQPAVAVPAPATLSPEIEALLKVLQDDAQRAELIRALRAAAPEAEGLAPAAPASTEPALLAPNTLGAQLLQGASQRLAGFSAQLVATVQTIADLPAMLGWLASLARDPITQSRVLDASWKLILVLGLGLLAEWAAMKALRRPRDWLDAQAPPDDAGWVLLKRVPLVLGRLGLDLIPVAAFALVSYGLISAVRPLPSTQLVMLTANNAYIASRAVMAAARMLLSPASSHLRILPVLDETAAYATIWLRRIVLVLVSSYAVAEAGLQFGLPWSAHDSILRVALLLVTLFLVIIILQNRQPVSAFLRAPALAEGEEPDRARRFFRMLRDRASDIWHLVAIAWLIAAWGVWALEIQSGFWRLLKVSFSTILILSLAKLADMAMRRVVQRAIDDLLRCQQSDIQHRREDTVKEDPFALRERVLPRTKSREPPFKKSVEPRRRILVCHRIGKRSDASRIIGETLRNVGRRLHHLGASRDDRFRRHEDSFLRHAFAIFVVVAPASPDRPSFLIEEQAHPFPLRLVKGGHEGLLPRVEMVRGPIPWRQEHGRLDQGQLHPRFLGETAETLFEEKIAWLA